MDKTTLTTVSLYLKWSAITVVGMIAPLFFSLLLFRLLKIIAFDGGADWLQPHVAYSGGNPALFGVVLTAFVAVALFVIINIKSQVNSYKLYNIVGLSVLFFVCLIGFVLLPDLALQSTHGYSYDKPLF